MFGLIWTLIILFSNLGDFFLIFFQRYFGFVLTRLFYGVAQTAGFALMGMYQKSPYNVIIGEVLLCFGAHRAFSQNIQTGDLYLENGTKKFSIFGTGIAMFGNIVFLVARKLDDSNTMAISDFLLFLSLASLIVHIRTLFLLPQEGFPSSITHRDNVFNSSWLGQILAKKKVAPEIKEEKTKSSTEDDSIAFRLSAMRRMSRAVPAATLGTTWRDSLKEFLKILITRRFLLFTGIFLILLYRLQIAASHLNPWLDYTYSDLEASCRNQSIINSSQGSKSEVKTPRLGRVRLELF